MTWYRRGGLPKELREQLATGKIPPMPGDELPMDEWMRKREGRPNRAEEEQAKKMKAEQEKVEAIMLEIAQRAAQMQNIYGQTLGSLGQAAGGLQGITGPVGIPGADGVSSLPYVSTMPFGNNIFGPQQPLEPKPSKPSKPETTPEEAERKLTETGNRKIIVDEGK